MPTHSGPNIVDNGLVLSLDAADNNSFRGEPTNNLITNPLPNSTTGFYRQGGTGTITYDSVKGAVYWEQTAYSTWGTYFNFHPSFGGTLDTGAQYTFSVEYLNESDFADSLFNHQLVQGNGVSSAASNGNITSHVTNLSDGWKRYSYTFTPKNTGVGTPFNRFMTGNRSSNVLRMYFRKIQFEKKSNRTRFTTGTRGTTVATGGGWKDLSGSNNHGEIINGVTTSNDQIPQGALEFDGVNDYLKINNSNKIQLSNNSPFTISYFINLNRVTGTYMAPIMKGSFTSSYGHLIGNNNLFLVYTDSDSGTELSISNLLDNDVNKWVNIVQTYDGSTIRVYRNGELSATSPSDRTLTTNTSPLYIGSNNGGTYFLDGKISNVKLYNRALTATEIQQNYNSQKSRFGL